MAIVSIFVNSGLIVVTHSITEEFTSDIRAYLYFAIVATLLMLRWLIIHIFPCVPLEVDMQLRRQNYINSKIVEGVPDTKVLSSSSSKNVAVDAHPAAPDILTDITDDLMTYLH
jgi:hypothetical protein